MKIKVSTNNLDTLHVHIPGIDGSLIMAPDQFRTFRELFKDDQVFTYHRLAVELLNSPTGTLSGRLIPIG
jgi:hypothetical protein